MTNPEQARPNTPPTSQELLDKNPSPSEMGIGEINPPKGS